MSYTNIINESSQIVYNRSVATKILDLITKLRVNPTENEKRRWIWELIQNAKDAANNNQPINIEINLVENKSGSKVEFSHNGSPFSIENLKSLIEQVSNKERKSNDGIKPKTTGKFGTGFLTTHLLSEVVELEGIVKELDHPYKLFKILLDRSGRELDEIIESVNSSNRSLFEIENNKTLEDYDSKQMYTTFRYFLESDGIISAKTGINDLELSLPFVFALIPEIQTISINSSVCYNTLPHITILDDGIEVYTIEKNIKNNSNEHHIVVLSSNDVSIAIEIEFNNGKITLKKPDNKLPRLFCDFPLIGSENFNIPVVINSPLFNSDEPRSGIFLSDSNEPIVLENKRLIIIAKNLYLKLIEFASKNNWHNLHILANIKLPNENCLVDKKWYLENILNPIYESILSTPIVDSQLYGLIPIICGGYNNLPIGSRVDFPYHTKKEIRSQLWDLLNNQYFIIPKIDEYEHWSLIIWDEKYKVTLITIKDLIENKCNINELANCLKKSIEDTIKWLNHYYTLLNEEGEYIKQITQDAIYPNQNNIFKKKEDLYFEQDEISDILKDVLKDLGIDIRDRLLHKSINIELSRNNLYTNIMLGSEITKLIKPKFAETNYSEDTRKIFKTLYLWICQNKNEAELIFEELYKNKHKLLDNKDIISSLEKAEIFDSILDIEPNFSVERLQKLLDLETLSLGFSVDKEYSPDEEQKIKNFITGWKGEAFVYKQLLSKNIIIEWDNKSDVETLNKIEDYEGEIHFIEDKMQKHDLVITQTNGSKNYIQVKSTVTDISKADQIAMPISVREWNYINEISDNDIYTLARVFNINHKPEVYFMTVEKINNI